MMKKITLLLLTGFIILSLDCATSPGNTSPAATLTFPAWLHGTWTATTQTSSIEVTITEDNLSYKETSTTDGKIKTQVNTKALLAIANTSFTVKDEELSYTVTIKEGTEEKKFALLKVDARQVIITYTANNDSPITANFIKK